MPSKKRDQYHHRVRMARELRPTGGSGGIRTPDLGLMSPLLYP
jgi:hypothetical protein